MIKVIAFDLVGVLVNERDIVLSNEEEKLERLFGPNLRDDDYLKKASEDVLIMEVDSGKTLLEFLIDKGYDPEIKYIFNKKTISILYRKQKLNLTKFVSDDVLLAPVKELFSDDSLGD